MHWHPFPLQNPYLKWLDYLIAFYLSEMVIKMFELFLEA